MRWLLPCMMFLLVTYSGWGQQQADDWFTAYIEDVLVFLAEEDSENIEYVLQQIEDLAHRPLRLNDDLHVLEDIGLITDIQHKAYQDHIRQVGRLLSRYELQSIEGWDLETIRRVAPLLRDTRDLDQLSVSAGQLWQQLHTDLVAYAGRRYPESRGYEATDGEDPAYEGDPWRHYLLFRTRFQYRISAGIQLEKDAGESLFGGANDHYDFASFHLYWQRVNKVIKSIAVGDYRLNIGQGLILHNGFGGNKSGLVHQVKKGGRYMRPHTSTSEFNFFRGAALSLQVGDQWEVSAFASSTKEDGNILLASDTTDEELQDFFTSLQTSGLHRTEAERADEDQVRQDVLGGSIGFSAKRLVVHANVVHYQYDQPWQPQDQPYNQYRFRGDQLTSFSLDYTYQHPKYHLWGESAMSDNGAMAHIIGLQSGLSKQINWSSVFRHYPRDYQAINANSFGERRRAENEVGIYNALSYQFHPKMSVSGYADIWKNPWLTFNVDAPGEGQEYLLRFDYRLKRHLYAYTQYFHESRTESLNNDTGFNGIQLRKRDRLRLHLEYQASRSMKWRSRAEWHQVRLASSVSTGYLFYQDVIFGSLQFPLSLTARYAIFNTDDFDSRIYAYENNLLYNYLIPALSDAGYRYYINLRYRPMKSLTLEMRWAETVYRDLDVVGSGQEERQGGRVSELAFQLRYTFN